VPDDWHRGRQTGEKVEGEERGDEVAVGREVPVVDEIQRRHKRRDRDQRHEYHVHRSERRTGVIDRQDEEEDLLIEIAADVIHAEPKPVHALAERRSRQQPGREEQHQPDDGHVEHRHPHEREVTRADPHDRHAAAEGPDAVQPPERRLVARQEGHRSATNRGEVRGHCSLQIQTYEEHREPAGGSERTTARRRRRLARWSVRKRELATSRGPMPRASCRPRARDT
jgi:hypothetical protein